MTIKVSLKLKNFIEIKGILRKVNKSENKFDFLPITIPIPNIKGKCNLYLDNENAISFSYNDTENNKFTYQVEEVKGDSQIKYNFVEIVIKLKDLQNENFNFDDEDRKIRLQLEDGKNYKQTQ